MNSKELLIINKIFCLFFVLISHLTVNSQELKILTYNIRLDVASDKENRWDNRKEFLIGQLNFYAPLAFGIQEGFKHQLDAIKNGMKGYDYIGKGREDGAEKGEYSAIFYNTQDLTLLESNTIWLSESPEEPSIGWDASYKRVCTYGLFTTRNQERKFWIFNTHFDHEGEEARRKSARLIVEKINLLNKAKYPVILMGDFNLEPTTESISFLKSAFNDSHELAGDSAFGPEGTFNGFQFNKAVTRRLDYVFLSKGNINLLKYGILSDSKNLKYPSDHFPVFAIISFNEKE
ncbi:MAG: endonuclease/exonuclease/phosphatase family protein [Eudoraea sp.]